MKSPLLKSFTYARLFFTTTPQVIGELGRKPSGVGRADLRHDPALRAQIAAQLARDVERQEAGVVGAHVERVARHPDVVHAAVLGLVPGDFLRVRDVAHVEHVQPAVGARGLRP